VNGKPGSLSGTYRTDEAVEEGVSQWYSGNDADEGKVIIKTGYFEGEIEDGGQNK
jgi:hypothetical protein